MSDPFIQPGEDCPELALVDSESGSPVVLSDLLQGESTFLYWIKIECPVCCQAVPYVERMSCRTQARGLEGRVFLVAQNRADELPAFREAHGCPKIPILCEPEPYESAKRLGLFVVPAWFLLAKDGVVLRANTAFSPSELTEIDELMGAEVNLFTEQELAELPALRPG